MTDAVAGGAVPEGAGQDASPSVELGLEFRAARDRAGMTRDEVADALHLDVAVVAALEDGRFESLPMRAYARGYVRNYARILGLDADDLARRFDAADAGRPEPSSVGLRPRVSRRPELALRPLALGYAAIVGILLVALGAVLWTAWRVQDWPFPFLGEDAPGERVEEPLASGPPDATESPASPPTVSRQPIAVDGVASEERASAASAAAEPLASAASEVAEPSASAAPPLGTGMVGELTMVFEGESWVSVDDATGTRLFGDLGRGGETVTLEGPVPLTVLVGNALAVRVQFDRELVDLEPFTSENNVARFELGGS